MPASSPERRRRHGTYRQLCCGLLASVVSISALAAQSPGRRLPLAEAVRVALEQRADLDAVRAGVTAAAGAVRQAGVGPNPTISFLTENWRLSGTPDFSVERDLELYAYVTQRMEIGGKRRKRIERAEADARVAAFDRDRFEWNVRQAVKRAYWHALAAQERERLLRRLLESASDLVRYHEVRWREGAASEADWIKVRLEEDRALVTLTTASLEAERALYELFRQMGEPPPLTPVQLEEQPRDPTHYRAFGVAAVQRWVDIALEARAEIQRQRAVVERAAATVQVEQAAATPDVSPYVGYKRAGGYNTLVGGMSMPLPLRDRNAGRIGQAQSLEMLERSALRAEEARVRNEIAAGAAAVRHRGELLETLGTGMGNRAQETFDIAQAAYREGAVGLLYLLDAQRSSSDMALLRNQVLFDYQLSWVDLETAVGSELDGSHTGRRSSVVGTR